MYYVLGLCIYLVILWLLGLSEIATPGHIFVPHDTFYPVNDFLNTTAFATFNSAFNYSNNLAGMMVLSPDAISLEILKTFFSNEQSQVLHVFLCLMVFFSLSYICLKEIYPSSFACLILCLCYCLSPFASIFYSAGIIYQLSTAIGLGILPLLLMRLINLDQEKDIFQLILLIFLLSYGLLFLYPALLLTTFVIVLIWHKNGLTYVADLMGQLNDSKRIFIIITLLLPLTVFAYLFLQAGHDKSGYLENGTSSAIQGGVFYPLMQISAWGLYNTWSPRAILSFHSYFFENPYRLLSISLIALLFYFLIKNKKFMPIYAIVFLAFFAKGPNAPFGEFFLAIINHFPLGYMIRSPDTKFGAFIAAWFAISVYYLTSKQRIAVVTLMGIFLLTNIVGIYSHGAISSIRGDIATTTFIEDPESRKIIDLINGQKNSLLITNFESCSEELYENKLHTCHGLIATSINRQLVHAQGRRIEDIITKYEMFPTLILINKRLRKEKNVPKDLLSHVHMLYDSNNYSLYYRESTNESCKNWHSFGCIRKNSSIVLSIPQSAYKYYYGGEYTTTEDGFIALPQEPLDAKDMPRNILFTLCGLAYLLIFIVVITGLKKSKLFFKN